MIISGHNEFPKDLHGTFLPTFYGLSNSPLVTRHSPLSFNLFPFNNFRTAMRDRNALNSFRFIHLRTTLIATEEWGVWSITTNHSPRLTLVCFQRLTTVKFCNPSVLITIQIAGGGGRGSSRNQQLTSSSTLPPHFDSLCFHALTHCPICKPFVLITLQQYPGVVGGLANDSSGSAVGKAEAESRKENREKRTTDDSVPRNKATHGRVT